MITPVILAGGTGSRLWPLSRSTYPKQLQCFFLHYGDLTDSTNLTRILQNVQPDELYNLVHNHMLLFLLSLQNTPPT